MVEVLWDLRLNESLAMRKSLVIYLYEFFFNKHWANFLGLENLS
jgi:hypothetical protein